MTNLARLEAVDALVKQLLREPEFADAVGVLVFGSFAAGARDEESDLDVAVFFDDERLPSSTARVFRDIRVEVLCYPLQDLKETIGSPTLRKREDTWSRVCFWLNLLRNGRLIHDPTGVLHTWKQVAAGWQWYDEEIQLVRERIRQNILLAEELLRENRLWMSVVALRDAANLALVHAILQANAIPSYRPKDLYNALTTFESEARKTYDYIMGVHTEQPIRVRKLLDLLTTIYRARHLWSPAVRRALATALRCLRRKDLKLAVLSSRHFALEALVELCEYAAQHQYFNATTHQALLQKAAKNYPQVYQAYHILHAIPPPDLRCTKKLLKKTRQFEAIVRTSCSVQ